MEFERCEIKANKYGSLEPMYEFVAEAVGPHGTYIVARTSKFRRSFIPLPFVHGYGEFQDKPFHREMLNQLVNHLIEAGWEPLTLSGVDWYSCTFQRRISPQKKSSSFPEEPSNHVDFLREKIAQ